MIIRDATLGDSFEIAELIDTLNHEEGNTTSIAPTSLAYALFEGDPRLSLRALVAEKANNVLGVLLYHWGFDTISASYGYYVADVIVAGHARRQSIGRNLFATLARQCKTENGQWISLSALKKNTVAKQFYLSLGMKCMTADFYALGLDVWEKLG